MENTDPFVQFATFPKMARYSREALVTEKIDGSNASICITDAGQFLTGSRTRWITPEDDNFGFSRWAHEHKEELMKLGVGRHYGEWMGCGIQRNYGIAEKRFYLFNSERWSDFDVRPTCCQVVPVLWRGDFGELRINEIMADLKRDGSRAVPGWMNPEGICVFHIAGNVGFKKTFVKDGTGKWDKE